MAMGFSALIVVVASILAFFAVWFRVDSLDDLWFIRVWDVIIGLLFSGAS
jgi:hypothetical protein